MLYDVTAVPAVYVASRCVAGESVAMEIDAASAAIGI